MMHICDVVYAVAVTLAIGLVGGAALEENATSAALGPAVRIVLETPDTHVPPYVVEPEGAIDTPAPDSDSPSGASSGVSGAVSAAFERVEGPDKTTYTVEEFYAVLAAVLEKE